MSSVAYSSVHSGDGRARFWEGHGFSRAARIQKSRASAAEVESSPHVHKQWKSCAHDGLTVRSRASNLNRFPYKFRGQSVGTSVPIAWTGGAPLRRKAIRSLTTRLNVPVVRWKSRVRIRAISQDRPSHAFEREGGSLPTTRRQTTGFK